MDFDDVSLDIDELISSNGCLPDPVMYQYYKG